MLIDNRYLFSIGWQILDNMKKFFERFLTHNLKKQ